ncbi:methionine ABC transporter ATP-binding protein [Alicyclobacillus cycloheptanicus]|uniref:D-methionine transport system ATP-binding protein n=1 Tax=Alicyclobacillus cycloheptanicus TaxID=1457 RepID=A0ABT9XIY6_9BACL|nr:ATP-binding cassette domain-containing protein [Alicyclobacillus cycloheptanicus]MDQ0190272.1 D-methionine transport system ATP-binding protein [Alicyclobacillus cycloheptanicus]
MITIRLHNVSKTYGSGKQSVRALTDVSIEIPSGEIFGLIGYSGAGKSTLLRCINLLERPSAGEVWVDDVALQRLGKRDLQQARRKIGMIFQHFHLLHSKTVADNIAFPLKLAKLSKAQRQQRVQELLHLVGLAGYEHKYPAQLSGGQKQRVAIARALANDPTVLLCDEATSALDPQTTDSILDLLLQINRRLGLTIVIVTHEIAVVRKLCDRVAVMANGRVLEQGPVAEVFLAPQHDVTRQLLGIAAPHGTVDTTQEDTVATAAGEPPMSAAARLHVACAGAQANQPVLAEVAAMTNTTYTILRGTVDTLKDTPFARFTVLWNTGSQATLQAVVDALRARGCQVEIQGTTSPDTPIQAEAEVTV